LVRQAPASPLRSSSPLCDVRKQGDWDNVRLSLSGVPETATWAMMLAGFAGLGFAAYRRMKIKVRVAAA
jgi:hypothetical protein